MQKPSDYFKKLDLAHLDANTAQFIREKVLTLPNIDILEGTKEFETIKAIVEESFPRAIGIEPVVIEPVIEVVPEPIIEAVVEPIIDTKQEEIKTISGQVSEMTDLIDLLSELVAENPSDLDSLDVLELYKESLVELSDKLKSLTEVITEAVTDIKDNIEEVKEVIKTDVVDTKGILTAPKQYKTEDGENVLGYESNWNIGTKKHLGETVVYYVSNEENKDKYSVLSGILHKGEIVYSEDKTSNKEFENYSENADDALKLAFELANDKDMVDKFENGGEVEKWKSASTIKFKTKKEANKRLELMKSSNKKDERNYLIDKIENGDSINNGYVVKFEYLEKDKFQKGGSVKSFSPESLIGYSFLGNVESSTIIGVREVSKDNIKLERKSNVGELKYESSFTLKELKDLYSGKKVGQYEAFKPVMEKGGEIDEVRSGAVVKWKGKEGAYHVSGTYEGTATLVPINPDPNRDYKGSYKVDINDLELIQKSNTPKDLISEWDEVLYKDADGEFTKKGKIEKMYYQDGILLYKVKDAGSYTRDEIKKIK